jgi:hypothetical protein
MQQLYVLEQQMRDKGTKWEERTRERKEHAVPVLERLGKWLEENQYRYRPTGPMGKAIAYTHSRWAGLSAYVLHGQMEIDNYLNKYIMRRNQLKACLSCDLGALFRPITSHNIYHFANSFSI